MAMALMLGPINAAAVDSGGANSGDVLTADGSGGASWQAPSNPSAPVGIYVARMYQSGQNAPTQNIIKNTLGITVTWSYGSTGVYYGAISPPLSNYSHAMVRCSLGSMPNDVSLAPSASFNNANLLVLITYLNSNGEDSALEGAYLEIVQY